MPCKTVVPIQQSIQHGDGTDPLRVLDVLAEREGLPPRWLRG